MNEKHVVSLELSKKLKEVGYPQEGEFWWVSLMEDDGVCRKWDIVNLEGSRSYIVKFAAPLASELMDACIRKSNIVWKIFCSRHNEWLIYSSDNDCGFQAPDDFPEFVADTFCNALAKMYLYLAEQGLLGGTK